MYKKSLSTAIMGKIDENSIYRFKSYPDDTTNYTDKIDCYFIWNVAPERCKTWYSCVEDPFYSDDKNSSYSEEDDDDDVDDNYPPKPAPSSEFNLSHVWYLAKIIFHL